MYICNCIVHVHVSRYIILFGMLSLYIVCIHVFTLFSRLERPAGWICAHYKSLLLVLLFVIMCTHSAHLTPKWLSSRHWVQFHHKRDAMCAEQIGKAQLISTSRYKPYTYFWHNATLCTVYCTLYVYNVQAMSVEKKNFWHANENSFVIICHRFMTVLLYPLLEMCTCIVYYKFSYWYIPVQITCTCTRKNHFVLLNVTCSCADTCTCMARHWSVLVWPDTQHLHDIDLMYTTEIQ